MNIWEFNRLLSQRLLIWSGFSIAAGLLMLPSRPFWRGFGAQAAGWGAVDALIALVGQFFARRAQQSDDTPERRRKEARSLRRLLWINTGLDVLYMLGGWAWARRKPYDAYAQGTGWGIVAQGAFLFVFDLTHALQVPDEPLEEAHDLA